MLPMLLDEAFRRAMFAENFEATADPAESSAILAIRLPVDNLLSDFCNESVLSARILAALLAPILVFINISLLSIKLSPGTYYNGIKHLALSPDQPKNVLRYHICLGQHGST